jgi:catechol 2,3-dioxygenase-like lactoylglutathione lyase family enzyme|tara:strand:- start:127 stop:516 length:390 start_codon:yes stop_codon:yes gene_type:complete
MHALVCIKALDHIALRVQNVEAALSFYAGLLGLPTERVELWRDNQVPFPSVRLNPDTLIDLMEGVSAGSDLDHYCLVIEATDMVALKARFEGVGVAVQEGPATRWGAHGEGTSLYILDPDGHVVELRHY